MLKSVPIQTIGELHRTGTKRTGPANFIRFPYFEYFEKLNPCDVIISNSILQVIVAMVFHNDYYSGCNVPFQTEFTTPMPIIEFVSLPTIQLFPSIFKNLRVFTRDKLISGIWAKELTEETMKAYEMLTEEGKIDNCLTILFRTKNAPNPLNGDIHDNVCVYEFELDSEQENLVVSDPNILRNKLFIYLVSELSRNGNSVGGIPLQGWSKDEMDSCEYLHELKRIFKRVLVYGSGEQWQSMGLLVSSPFDFSDLILGETLPYKNVIGVGYSHKT